LSYEFGGARVRSPPLEILISRGRRENSIKPFLVD
jgi:hypothetical protein